MNVSVKIPQQAEILIEAGQAVDFTTPLLKKNSKKTVQIPLSEILGFAPDKIFLKIKKTIGDPVKKGDLLAEEIAFLSAKRYFSQIDGVLREIRHDTGAVIIEQETQDAAQMNCYFQGEVAAIHDGYIELKVKGSHKAQTTEPVEYMGAQVYYAPEGGIPFSEEDVEGKCIFALEFNPMDHPKVEALGAHGLILREKLSVPGTIAQIILETADDVEHISKKKYPFFIVGPEENTLYFYE